MALSTDRRTVDFSAFPELVVIYLGMRVNELRGLKTLFGFGPKIAGSVAEQPDGLLLHEKLHLFAVAAAPGHAPVLARLRLHGGVGAVAATQGVVGELRARHGGYGLLA